MRPGDKTECPHCGRTTFLQKKALLDGWKCVGEALVCGFCGKKIADPEEASAESGAKNTSAADRLKSLLGDVDEPVKPVIFADPADKRFCKDCKFMVTHPFHLRCELTGKDVEPMDDCEKYQKRIEK